MDEMQMDLSQLVAETCALGEHIAREGWPASSPGVFYRIHQQEAMCRIEAVASENMRDEGPEWPLLRAGGHHFATPSLELAQVVVDLVADKRFPLVESTCYNIGDPVENWWMVREDNAFKILFRSHGLQESSDQRALLLGPLGDSEVVGSRLQQLEPFLQRFFPLVKFAISPKMIHVVTMRCEDGSVASGFEQFAHLFGRGEVPQALLQRVDQGDSPTIIYYLHELAVMRQFWMQVYRFLDRKN